MAILSGVDLSDRPNFYFEANNRNKRSLTVDLKKPEGREALKRLEVEGLVRVEPNRGARVAALGKARRQAALVTLGMVSLGIGGAVGLATLLSRPIFRLVEGTRARLIDTRKTTPLFREYEKQAVRIGGGYNLRMGLYDMIMLKDNHIDYCGGIEKAIELASSYVREKKPQLKIEIEARSINDVNRIVAAGNIDRIMLDNFSPPEIIAALEIIDRKYETEASGGINFDNLEEYAQTGVDFISSGAIIHQATSVDLSLKATIL